MSGQITSWWTLFWMEGLSLIVLTAPLAFFIAVPLVPRLDRKTGVLIAVATAALSLGTLAWGRWITGLKGMEPIWWGSAEAGLALGWTTALVLTRRSHRHKAPV